MNRFKIGDRVRIIHNKCCGDELLPAFFEAYRKGGTVIKHGNASRRPYVETFEPMEGRLYPSRLYFRDEELVLIPPPPVNNK